MSSGTVAPGPSLQSRFPSIFIKYGADDPKRGLCRHRAAQRDPRSGGQEDILSDDSCSSSRSPVNIFDNPFFICSDDVITSKPKLPHIPKPLQHVLDKVVERRNKHKIKRSVVSRSGKLVTQQVYAHANLLANDTSYNTSDNRRAAGFSDYEDPEWLNRMIQGLPP